ncbi:barstar family protein [Chitiniphilus shinanonensis]
MITVDLSKVATPQALQLLLRDSLAFPGWYGCNWDAFWDGITALVEMPETLKLVGWAEFEKRLPRDARIMRECLNDMEARYPALASKVVYA